MRNLTVIVLALVAMVARAEDVATPKRPNILFIFTDDHAQHAVSC